MASCSVINKMRVQDGHVGQGQLWEGALRLLEAGCGGKVTEKDFVHRV